MGKRGPRGRNQVSTEWSADLAYAVGLIASDGCLSKDGRHITFTSKDLQLVDIFISCLGLKYSKVGFTKSGSGTLCYRVQLSDINFYNWLLDLGITPKKSLTLGPLKIPRRFFFDFLRGSFDGDGSVHAYWDKRWRNSFMFYISFASASMIHVQWLQDRVYKIIKVRGAIKKSRTWYQLAFAKHSSRKLYKAMFYSHHVVSLQRKRLKLEKILESEKIQHARVL